MSYHEKQYCHDCIPSYTIISMIPPSSRKLGGIMEMKFRESPVLIVVIVFHFILAHSSL